MGTGGSAGGVGFDFLLFSSLSTPHHENAASLSTVQVHSEVLPVVNTRANSGVFGVYLVSGFQDSKFQSLGRSG